ncbi:MAG: Amidohydrolase, partial [Bacteroidetes bacterium]|nr:Amidohydrolase [Bacteroidota bacterium]
MQFIKADRVFDGEKFISNDQVLAVSDNGRLHEIINETKVDPLQIQKLKGVICPGFINAHCHTELSHLKNKIAQQTGLPGFGKSIIFQRATSSKDEVKEHIQLADKEMWENGIVAVGDICNTADSFDMKTTSGIFYHSFIELLGLNPERATLMYDAGVTLINELKNLKLAGSLSPHAPYSTSKELILKISQYNLLHNLPASIHNQESMEETKFFNGENSGFHELYKFLQVDISWFAPPKTSSLSYYIESLLQQNTLLVHNTCTTMEDIGLTINKNIHWCFCPAANQYIERRLPDFKLFMNETARICLGTDSLASNTALSLVNEANLVLSNSSFSMEEVLKMMTLNGAKALNISETYGRLIPGKNAGLNLLEING